MTSFLTHILLVSAFVLLANGQAVENAAPEQGHHVVGDWQWGIPSLEHLFQNSPAQAQAQAQATSAPNPSPSMGRTFETFETEESIPEPQAISEEALPKEKELESKDEKLSEDKLLEAAPSSPIEEPKANAEGEIPIASGKDEIAEISNQGDDDESVDEHETSDIEKLKIGLKLETASMDDDDSEEEEEEKEEKEEKEKEEGKEGHMEKKHEKPKKKGMKLKKVAKKSALRLRKERALELEDRLNAMREMKQQALRLLYARLSLAQHQMKSLNNYLFRMKNKQLLAASTNQPQLSERFQTINEMGEKLQARLAKRIRLLVFGIKGLQSGKFDKLLLKLQDAKFRRFQSPYASRHMREFGKEFKGKGSENLPRFVRRSVRFPLRGTGINRFRTPVIGRVGIPLSPVATGYSEMSD